MDCFRVHGGPPLSGRVPAAGSKNAILPLLAASLLVEGTVRFTRVPDLRDVKTLLDLLEVLGAGVERGPGEVALTTPAGGPTEAPYEIVRRMRASISVLGPLLARRGGARVSLPGGCVIGDRPVDLHLKGLAALGAEIRIEHGTIVARAPGGGLRGGRIVLASERGPTVLGTANVMMAASLARGTTVIESAAEEPEVAGLADFLNACGARIAGAGGPRIEIEGVDQLQGAVWANLPDRIETGTLLLAGAATRGEVRVEACRPRDLGALLELLERSGVPCEQGRDWVAVRPWKSPPRALEVCARPFPGFPTDLQAQWTAFCTVSHGRARITDAVYPDRFLHVPELNRLGASIRREGDTAQLDGPAPLSGAPVLASDLRASAGLVIAGLVAEGVTTVRRIYHLDRGYERLEDKLSLLGARVERVVDPEAP